MPNILFTFSSNKYNVTAPSTLVSSFSILKSNMPTNTSHIRYYIDSQNGSVGNVINSHKSDVTSNNGFIVNNTTPPVGILLSNSIGLITDTHMFNTQSPNLGRMSYRIRIKNSSTLTPTLNSQITINRIIMFGDISPTNNFDIYSTSEPDIGKIVNDENVLTRDSIINAFTMDDSEHFIMENGVTDMIIDSNNSNANDYILNPGKSLFIEPTIAETVLTNYNRFVCVRAMLLEVTGVNKGELAISLISLNSGINRIATMTNLFEGVATQLLIIFNPISATSPIYSNFSVLPTYNRDHFKDDFNVLPSYVRDDSYYNPVSEISQKPYNYY